MATLITEPLDLNQPIGEPPQEGAGVISTPYFEDLMFKIRTDLLALNTGQLAIGRLDESLSYFLGE